MRSTVVSSIPLTISLDAWYDADGSACIVSTYNKNTGGCFKVTRTGTFFLAPFDATIKGVTCESSTAVSKLALRFLSLKHDDS